MCGMKRDASATSTQVTTTVREARRRHPAVGRGRLYTALKNGDIRSVKVGKRIAVDVCDLDRWVMAGAPLSRDRKVSD